MRWEFVDLGDLRRGLERALERAELRVVMSGMAAAPPQALADAQGDLIDAVENLSAYRKAIGASKPVRIPRPAPTAHESEIRPS